MTTHLIDALIQQYMNPPSTNNRYFANPGVRGYCKTGCLAAANVQYDNKVTNCAIGTVSSDCRCDLNSPTNDCVKGRRLPNDLIAEVNTCSHILSHIILMGHRSAVCLHSHPRMCRLCEGRVCSLPYGERTCHKASETAERNVKDELKACTTKCQAVIKGVRFA